MTQAARILDVDQLLAAVQRHPRPVPQELLARAEAQGVQWLTLLRDAGIGALPADGMGLGKTLQALCALRGRTLVVAPTSVLRGWAADMARLRPSLSVCVYHGANRRLGPAADVTLTSYALLRLEVERLAAQAWDCLALDEACPAAATQGAVASRATVPW